MRFLRSHRRRPTLVAEQFVAPVARLSGITLPLDVIARQPVQRLRILVFAIHGVNGSFAYRAATLTDPHLSPQESLRLEFAPFAGRSGTSYCVGALDLSSETATPVEVDLQAIRAAAAARTPIVLACRGEAPRTATDPLTDEHAIVTYRCAPLAGATLRPAYGLDAFWCDASGIYLHGWAHAHEHPVRALRVEAAGRSVRADTFTDRPDLLAFYPEHEHVRHAGFTVYLACPPGHPVRLTLETDGGEVSVPLALPDGPLPRWSGPEEPEGTLSPMLRRFVELANAHGGRVLQIGARSAARHAPAPPRPLLRGPVIGLDIHPGCCVDLVGDAQRLSHFCRERSFEAVVSASVLEHLQAPWLVAAEINRVLEIGGLVYHQAPTAWPAHAQPNDFWRMSADGLRVLFGPECGFEVLEARDFAVAAMIPSPQWRSEHLAMPTVPTFATAEILARKVRDIQLGAVAWPLRADAGEARARRYPVSGLRLAPPPPGDPS